MADVQSLLAANEKLSREVLGPGADQIDQARRFPRENIAALGQAGVLGLLVPAQFGGAGASLGEMSRVLDTQAQACASTAMVTLMHYCATAVIAAKGSDKLKQELLPSIARGGHLSTLAFSEAGSGGHFYAPVSEVRQKRLSASKSFVTSAGEADSYVVSARKAGAAGPTESNLYLISKGTSGRGCAGAFRRSGPGRERQCSDDAHRCLRRGRKAPGPRGQRISVHARSCSAALSDRRCIRFGGHRYGGVSDDRRARRGQKI